MVRAIVESPIPVVSAVGDVVTVPALFAATALVLATGAFLRWDAAPLVSLSLGDWLRRWWTDGGVAPPDVWNAMMRASRWSLR